MLLGMQTDESSREAVQARLAPHLDTLEKCFRQAWRRWVDWLPELKGAPTDISPRSRASVIYDFIVAEAVQAFLSTPGIRVQKERGFLVLRFQDRVALRFKKFGNKKLSVSRNNTRQTQLYDAQMLEFAPGTLQSMAHVTAGYLLDNLALDMSVLAITCTENGRHMWAPIEIIPPSVAPVTRIPSAPVAEAPVPTIRSTRRNKAEVQKDPGTS
jgi:hypothetical protein